MKINFANSNINVKLILCKIRVKMNLVYADLVELVIDIVGDEGSFVFVFAFVVGRRRHRRPILRLFVRPFLFSSNGSSSSSSSGTVTATTAGPQVGVLKESRYVDLVSGQGHVEVDFRDHGGVHLSNGRRRVVLLQIRDEPVVTIVRVHFEVEDFAESLEGGSDDVFAESVSFDEDRVALLFAFPLFPASLQIVAMNGAFLGRRRLIFATGRSAAAAAAPAAAFTPIAFGLAFPISSFQAAL